MNISGTCTEIPLPELLQLLSRCNVTGCLSLSIPSLYYPELLPRVYKIWFIQGHIVSVQKNPHNKDIYALAIAKKWMRTYTAQKLKARSPNHIPAGLYLESQGVLKIEQLRILFCSEVFHRLESLFSCKTIEFQFQATIDLPMDWMTGLGIAASSIAQNSMGCIKISPLKKSILAYTSSSNGIDLTTIKNADKNEKFSIKSFYIFS